MMKIERLTAEQEAMMPQFVEYGLKIGLSTERSDREAGDAAMTLVPGGWMITHLSEIGVAGGCVCQLGNPLTSQDAMSDDGAKTMALAAAAIRAGGK